MSYPDLLHFIYLVGSEVENKSLEYSNAAASSAVAVLQCASGAR